LSDGSVDFSEPVAAAPEPSTTVLRGTVNAEGDPTAVSVTLTPIELGATDATAPVGFRGAVTEAPSGKIWSARTATLADLAPTVRRTVAIAPVQEQPNDEGVWLFDGVIEGQSYEVAFVRPGYDTQAFVVTPPAGSDPIDLDVEMVPSKGSLSGAVLGPSGGLGGAEVTVTDGTLTFTTTSADDTGEWSIDAVSTPGVYTVSAALRGFATAVQQVELGAGDTPDDVDLRMVPGLGTMTGRVVDDNGVGLGGATVTASNGETTLTTTTLTDGNVGFFSLPQLQIPATYTVAVELDGYITQTRRVPLAGSLGGIDFAMTSTTLRLTGQILSSGGGGITNATLTISTGDLKFRATTSQGGAFSIDRLPPGNYTVTIEHFQHESATEFLTLQAGVQPQPLRVTLPVTSGPPPIGTGSLTVTVTNDDPLAKPPGISGATVTLTRNRTTDAPRVITDATSPSVLFEDLPIGTYTIRVTAPNFNPSPPITETIGFSRGDVEIRLQKLGQASGTVVDSLSKAPLTGYLASIFKIQGAGDTLVETVAADADGKWQTSPDKLTVGTYRIEISPPPGYLVRGDQVLDPATGRPMSFVVPVLTAAEVKPVIVPAIEADAYPGLSGRIYKPRLNGANVAFDALDDPALTATATCTGKSGTPKPVVVKPGDEFGTVGTTWYDAFSISANEISAAIPPADLPGTCTVNLSTPDRTPASYTFTNVNANDGVTKTDRRVAIALAKPAPSVTGSVFWVDTGPNPDQRVPLPSTAISSTADPIVGFVPVESSLGEPTPGLDRKPVTATSTAPGSPTSTWTLDRQVFGTTVYQFVTPNFGIGLVPVTIDDTGTPTVPSSPPTAAVVTPEGGGFAVELKPPAPGTVSGTVTIETSRPRPAPYTNMVTATAPNGATTTVSPAPATGTFTISNADAGTWNLAFTTPPNHRLVSPPGGSATTVVGPGQPATPVNAAFVELGTVQVRLLNKGTTTPISPAPDAGLTLSGFANLSRPVGPPTAGNYTLAGVPVAASNAASTPVAYTAELDLAGYDLAGATVNGVPVDARAIPITVLAGEIVTLDIGVERYGTISGSVVGRTGSSPATEPLSFSPAAPFPATLEVVDDVTGSAVADATVVTRDDGTFTITGPAGAYRITPAQPQYQPSAPVVVVMANTVDNVQPPYELTLRTGSLNVRAVTDLSPTGTPVVGAVYTIAASTGSCVGVTGSPPGTTIDPAGTTITGLAPGTYCLAVNKFAGSVPDAFPAIVQVQIPRQVAGAPAATVVAPLPPLRPTVTGSLVAVNQLSPTPGTVQLIATNPTVSSTFDSTNNVVLNGTATANLNSGAADVVATLPPLPAVPTPADYAWSYTFTNLAYGTHTITAPDIPGYTLQTPRTATITVNAAGPSPGPRFVYQAAPRTVEFDLGSGVFPTLDATFPDAKVASLTVNGTTTSYTSFTLDTSNPARPNVLRFTGVAPDVRGYTLTFDDALHAPFSGVRNVPFNVSTTTPLAPLDGGAVAATADRVRLTGNATQRTGPSTTTDLTAGARLTLASTAVPAGTTYVVSPDAGVSTPGTLLVGPKYTIDATPGDYRLDLTQTGFFTTTIDPRPLPTAGTVVTQNIEIVKQSTVTVNATPAGGLAPPAGLQLRLVDAFDASVVFSPRGGTSNVFDVPAGTYRARATANDGYPTQLSGNNVVAAGASAPIALTLPRVARVSVTGPSTATVVVGAASAQTITPPATAEFLSPAISATGTLQATVSATGYRTQVVSIPESIFNTTPVALAPNVTASGTIAAPNGTNVITATAPGMADVRGSVSGGNYSISGLGVGTGGQSKDWTLSYDVVGGGTGTLALPTITSTSANTITANFPALSVADVDFDFSVTRAGSSPVDNLSGATITIRNGAGTVLATGTTPGSGDQTLTVKENTGPLTWTVTHPDSLTRSGSLTVTTRAATPVPVAMLAELTGSVTDASVGVVGASIRICPSTATAAPCPPGDPTVVPPVPPPLGTATTTTGGAFVFNDALAAGTYRVWAISGTKQGSAAVTVGNTTPAITIAIS
jgi:hypothetical protein